MDDVRPLHGPVRRWRSGFLRVRCRCGAHHPCPTLIAQMRHQAVVDEARRWRDEERRTSGYEDSVNNWWENPR